MEDLHELGGDLVTTAARIVRWMPTEGFTISLAAARILGRLQDRGPTRISDLALAERCSQPTITNHVKRLEAAGFVDRAVDPSDARSWLIGLTAAGRRQIDVMREVVGDNVAPFLARLSQRDLKALREGIRAMTVLMALDRPPRSPVAR